MDCPFYLLITCIHTGSGVFHSFHEIDSREVDIDDKEAVLSFALQDVPYDNIRKNVISLISELLEPLL